MKRIFLGMIRFYQKHITPHTPAACRFTPTCSQYAYGAINRFGAAKGIILAVRRLFRCHPFHPGGYDPVPEEFRWVYRKKRN